MLNNSIYIHHHLGLGDHIVCNGLVRKIVADNKGSDITLAVKRHNLKSVESLYKGSTIKFDPILNDAAAQHNYPIYSKVIRVGFEYCDINNWETSFYTLCGLDYSLRYSNFKIERDYDSEKLLLSKLSLPDKYIFCNISSSVGEFPITIGSNLPKIYLQPLTDSIFDWIPVIEGAQEIHTIDSSIFHLMKQLSLPQKKIYYNVIEGRTTTLLNDVEGWVSVSQYSCYGM